LRAGRLLATAGERGAAIGFIQAAVDRVPHSLNARISLLVALQLAGRFDQMVDHARWLMGVLPEDPQALRFAVQSGVWGGDETLAETAYDKLLEIDPRQAEAARRFIDNAPPAPRALTAQSAGSAIQPTLTILSSCGEGAARSKMRALSSAVVSSGSSARSRAAIAASRGTA